ncbi:MAG: hypothetical protein ACD_75C02640G0003, partial [uncultured bacterium]
AAAVAWLKELRAIAGQAPLPCMLGLSRLNKKIHPRFREAALNLQETTGLQLHEISPDVLHKELGYSAMSLLCLSPTDSMIEAIRCALELKAPVYGIDMDDTSLFLKGGAFTWRDPVSARDDLSNYVQVHGHLANQARDDHSNPRREIVMAARLKRLLMRHKRVLFTCGLAHWQNITRLLADASLLPASDVPQDGPVIYERVLVHPLKALQGMDIFPAITTAYETTRQLANRNTAHHTEVDFQEQFQNCLERTNVRYFESLADEGKKSRSSESNHGFGSYGAYLANLCLLSQQFTPDLSTSLNAARSMMPSLFVEALGDSLMEFQWASPSDFPDLPVIGPDIDHSKERDNGSRRATLKAPSVNSDGTRNGYETSTPFYLTTLHSEEGREKAFSQWKWQEEPPLKESETGRYSFRFIWPPCENLFYATIYEAINTADACRQDRKIEEFSDSLHEGLDLKASLRSCISGKNRLFVKRTMKKTARPVRGEPVPVVYSGQLELQPTVFIFSPETEPDGCYWEYLKAGDSELYEDLSSRGKRFFKQAGGKKGNILVESIHFSQCQSVPAQMVPWVSGIRFLYGSVRFGNPCANFYQSASWLEKGRFKVSPILSQEGGIQQVIEMYQDRYHLMVDLSNWGNALIQFALPYSSATRRVPIVAPKDFRISQDVHNEARRRKVELFRLPISHFPAERINLVRQQYSVRAGHGGKEYPPELERIFGHNQNTYQDLLPKEIRRQTSPRHNEQSKEKII